MQEAALGGAATICPNEPCTLPGMTLSSCVPRENQLEVPERYGLWLRTTGSAALLCSKVKEREKENTHLESASSDGRDTFHL